MKTSEKTTTTPLTYISSDGCNREVEGCLVTVDARGSHWIWSEQLECNIVYKTNGRENALIATIDSLLFTIQLRDERIAKLKRIADLATLFAEQVNPRAGME